MIGCNRLIIWPDSCVGPVPPFLTRRASTCQFLAGYVMSICAAIDAELAAESHMSRKIYIESTVSFTADSIMVNLGSLLEIF